MNNYKKYFVYIIILIQMEMCCQSNHKNMLENNKEVENWKSKETFPNNDIAYKKNDGIIYFYSPIDNSIYAEINLKSHNYKIYNCEMFYTEELIKINKFEYFAPKKFSKQYHVPIGDVGTAMGEFYSLIEYNDLGLIRTVTKDDYDKKNKYNFFYNKYGQLLKIVEDKLIDKIILENKYDDKSRLVSKTSENSTNEYFYDENNKLSKQSIKEGKVSYNEFFIYDSKKRLIEKYTDDKNTLIKYQYDEKGRITIELNYTAKIDLNLPKKLKTEFIEFIYEYGKDSKLIKATEKHYNISNERKVFNGEYINLSIDEQKSEALVKFKNKQCWHSQILYEYTYENNQLMMVKVVEQSIFCNETQNKITDVSENNIKYTYNTMNQIIKVEKTEGIEKKSSNIQVYSY